MQIRESGTHPQYIFEYKFQNILRVHIFLSLFRGELEGWDCILLIRR